MSEMNWDTHEAAMAITNERLYYDALQPTIGNELYFMVVLYVILKEYNETRGNENRIDLSKVNGNDVYIDFCDACGNETTGWK